MSRRPWGTPLINTPVHTPVRAFTDITKDTTDHKRYIVTFLQLYANFLAFTDITKDQNRPKQTFPRHLHIRQSVHRHSKVTKEKHRHIQTLMHLYEPFLAFTDITKNHNRPKQTYADLS